MKKIFYVFLLPLLFLSCSKEEDDDGLEKITDTIVGMYECRSATIQGRLLDLNGDGTAGDDMIAEFKGFDIYNWFGQDLHARVHPVKSYGEKQLIYITIPKQRVNYDKRTGEYTFKAMFGDILYIGFRYSVNESGMIITEPDEKGGNDYSYEDDSMIELIDYRNNCGRSLTFDQEGGFEAVIDCTCYDFATDEVVTVPVLFVYERVSYSLD